MMKKHLTLHLANTPAPEQVLGIFDDFTLEVCRNASSLNTAFRIRYHAYREVDSIPENDQELLYDEFDFLPNSRVFLVWHQGKPIATVRSCIYADTYHWLQTEAVTYFTEEVHSQLGKSTRILESNRFAVDPNFQGRQSLFARFLLFRAHALNAAIHECKYIMTSVRTNHVAFYQRFLGLNPISAQSQHVEWAQADVVLLANETDKCLGAILKRGMPDYDESDVTNYGICADIPHIPPQSAAA